MSQALLTELCVKELELCGVHEGETVVVVSQGMERLDYADAFMSAAGRLGAACHHLRLAPATNDLDADGGAWTVGVTPLAGNPAAVEALKQADIVIDLIFLLFSPEQLEVEASGTRVLLAVEPVDVLARLFPTTELRERVEAGGELLASAAALRFTNPAGTDVTYRLGAYPVVTEYGYTDTPGRWDHWPSGFLFTGAHDDGVDGRVVIAPGDIVYPFKQYASSPVELAIEQGRIVDVRGGGLDAALLRDYMESFGDPDAYGIAHIGWGLNERARWSSLATDRRGIGAEGRSFYGNVLFSTGPNQELGGGNSSPCHIDIPMRGCSLYLDDEPIIVDGDVVHRDMKAGRAAAAAMERGLR
jgi:2,5-dihydroxypyridine 5,6-dioxygenase